MNDKEKIEALLNHLGLSARKLAISIGLKSPQVFYDIKFGKCKISRDLASKITDKYDFISKTWLLTGEGEMLCPHINQKNVSGPNVVGESTVTNNAFPEELMVLLKNRDEEIKKRDEQMDRLLSILEKLTNK